MDEFYKLGDVITHTATSYEDSYNNMRYNVKSPYGYLPDMSVWKKHKNIPIALIGGGPSLKDHLEELRNFSGPTVACGSTHDFLVENGIIPTYSVICDPDPITANYLSKPRDNIQYLLATQCHPLVFEKLKGFAIWLWHCYNDDEKGYNEIDPDFKLHGAVGGGCTVGLRAINIAIMMGYKDIHFYGYDSSVRVNDSHHAYDFSTKDEQLGQMYEVKLAETDECFYTCAGYHLAQARQFVDFYGMYKDVFNPTFHGDGLLPATMRAMTEGNQNVAAD